MTVLFSPLQYDRILLLIQGIQFKSTIVQQLSGPPLIHICDVHHSHVLFLLVRRYMFFNPDDIRYFKPVELWFVLHCTALASSFHVSLAGLSTAWPDISRSLEALKVACTISLHFLMFTVASGYMKCIFDGLIKNNDTVDSLPLSPSPRSE